MDKIRTGPQAKRIGFDVCIINMNTEAIVDNIRTHRQRAFLLGNKFVIVILASN